MKKLSLGLTLCREFPRRDSRFGISGICLSSTSRTEISGTSYTQGRFELVAPLRADVGSLKASSSSARMLTGACCLALCKHQQKKGTNPKLKVCMLSLDEDIDSEYSAFG